MIKILENYGIMADNYNYVAGRITKRVDKSGAEIESITKPRYYHALYAAVRGCVEDAKRNAIGNEDMTIETAVQRLAELEQQFDGLCESVKAALEGGAEG